MDPYLLQQILGSVQPSPFGQQIQQDPNALPSLASDMTRLLPQQGTLLEGTLLPSEPGGDAAYGRLGQAFAMADPEQDAMGVGDVVRTILGAPFNLLRAGKEGLEDALGHRNSMMRDQQDAMLEQLQLAQRAVSDNGRAVAGMPVDRSMYAGLQAGGSEVGTGRSGATGAPSTPWVAGLKEIFTGEERKRKQRELMRLAAAYKAAGMNAELERLNAQTFASYGSGASGFARAGLYDARAREVPLTEAARRATEGAKQAQYYAGADENLAQAGTANARTTDILSLLPGKLATQEARVGQLGAATDLSRARADDIRAQTPLKAQSLDAQVAQRRSAAAYADARTSEVATGRKSLMDTVRTLNSANTPEEKADTMRALGIEGETRNTLGNWLKGIAGFDQDKEPDFAKLGQAMQTPLSTPTAPATSQLGTESATQAAPAPGQKGASSGRTRELMRMYPTKDALEAAYRARKITYAETVAALEAMGWTRAR